MLPAGVKFGVLPALNLKPRAEGLISMADDVQDQADDPAEPSEATIAVHCREEGYYPPPPRFIGQANASDPAILDRLAEGNSLECLREYRAVRRGAKGGATPLDPTTPPFWRWFVGGKLN